jgi:transcriptional regulator with XRE-family HTH domain
MKPELQLHDGGFSERLFHARARAGYTRKEVVELTQKAVSHRTLASWENDPDIKPRLGPGIRAVAEVLGVSIGFLLWGEE